MIRRRPWSTCLIALSVVVAGGTLPTGTAAAAPVIASEAAASLTVDAVDPTAATNPAGAPFPGCRGANQLIVYTRPGPTGTNEYGFEVTVENGRVVRRDGADSVVPPQGFVVSGHGSARAWIQKYLPIGTQVIWQPGDPALRAVQDAAADVWRARALWGQVRALDDVPPPALATAMAALDRQAATAPAAASTQARRLLPDLRLALWRAYRPLPADARAVWYRPLETNAGAVAETVAAMHRAGIRTIYLESLYHGYPIYPSVAYRKWGLATQYPRYAGWDPLDAYIRAAADQGMTVVPWVHTLYSGHDSLKGPGPILSVHPDWANRQRSAADRRTPVASTVEGGAYFLDPASPEVRAFLADVLVELVRRYPVAAVQLDDTRYPLPFPEGHPAYLESTWGYSPLARAAFRRHYGQDPLRLSAGTAAWSAWTEFRRRQLTQLMQVVVGAIRQAGRPVAVQVPFATNPQESFDRALQDWPAWSDEHLIDAFAVLNYTNSVAAVRQNVLYAYYATAGTVPLIGGVFGPFLSATPTETLAQAQAARAAHAGVIGLFSWQQVSPDLTEALRAGLFAPLAPPDGPTP